MIKVENVSMKFRMANDRITSLKEFMVKKIVGKLEYKEFIALKDVSFSIEKGDVVGVIGKNGAGKSTLLKIISGILSPTSGRLEVSGNIAPMLELGAGFDVDLTARENIFLNGAVLGYSKKYLTERYQDIVDFSELHDFMDTPIRNFSSGMIMRLAFSIATLVNPDILIVDEILSVGDSQFQKKSAKRMRELMSGGTTVLLVSHSIDQIRSMCNKVVWLEHGTVRMVGNAQEVCREYTEFSKQEYLLKEQKNQLVQEASKSNAWKEELYSPTHIEKIGTEYFIVDCWHQRVIYNSSLSAPIKEWKTLSDTLGNSHSISSDGEVFLVDETNANEIRVFVRNGETFNQTQIIDRVGESPNRTVYDVESQTFFGISAMSQHVFTIKNKGTEVVTDKVIRLGYLQNDSYIRSIRIIDGELFFVSGPGKIIVADYVNSPFNITREYKVPFELRGMNDIMKFGSYYYISVYQNGAGEVAPKLVRTKDLSDLETSNYEDLHEILDLKGVPYSFSFIDDRVFLTEIDTYSRIISFVITDDEITDLQVHFDTGTPSESSLRKRKGE